MSATKPLDIVAQPAELHPYLHREFWGDDLGGEHMLGDLNAAPDLPRNHLPHRHLRAAQNILRLDAAGKLVHGEAIDIKHDELLTPDGFSHGTVIDIGVERMTASVEVAKRLPPPEEAKLPPRHIGTGFEPISIQGDDIEYRLGFDKGVVIEIYPGVFTIFRGSVLGTPTRMRPAPLRQMDGLPVRVGDTRHTRSYTLGIEWLERIITASAHSTEPKGSVRKLGSRALRKVREKVI